MTDQTFRVQVIPGDVELARVLAYGVMHWHEVSEDPFPAPSWYDDKNDYFFLVASEDSEWHGVAVWMPCHEWQIVQAMMLITKLNVNTTFHFDHVNQTWRVELYTGKTTVPTGLDKDLPRAICYAVYESLK